MRLRSVSAVLAAALAIGGLSACQTKVGQAAIVGSDRVSETDLGKYVTREGPTEQAKAAAAQNNQTLGSTKVEALTTILQAAVFEHALAVTSGGVPSSAQLAQLHDDAVQRILRGSGTGDQYDAGLSKQVVAYGFTARFATLVLRQAELEDALLTRLKSFGRAQQVINEHPLHISVSPRYGNWDPKRLVLSDTVGAGLPSFVTFGATSPSPSPSANP